MLTIQLGHPTPFREMQEHGLIKSDSIRGEEVFYFQKNFLPPVANWILAKNPNITKSKDITEEIVLKGLRERFTPFSEAYYRPRS